MSTISQYYVLVPITLKITIFCEKWAKNQNFTGCFAYTEVNIVIAIDSLIFIFILAPKNVSKN